MVETGSMRVLDILANASATIAEGEVLQLTAAQDLRTDEAIYLQVVRGKTAALFSAAMEVGGEIAGQDAATKQALYDYGDALGIAFQIADDVLDLLERTVHEAGVTLLAVTHDPRLAERAGTHRVHPLRHGRLHGRARPLAG